MQPFLNTQFVEFERERRGERTMANDPDGFLRDEYASAPDPVGSIFVRFAERVENLVRSVIGRGAERQETPNEAEGATIERAGVPASGSE